MKIKTLAVAATLSLIAGSAFANVTTITDTGTTTVGTPSASIKPSKNVTIYYNGATDLAGGYAVYSIESIHSSGSKKFGSSSGDQKIFTKEGTSYEAITPPGGAGSSADFAGWTAM